MAADRVRPGPTGDGIVFPRSSGVLLPIPCLPSGFGIGDLGPYSYRLADYLYSAGQRVWQILPLNPTSLTYQHSPYHSASSFACNPLLMIPERLAAGTGGRRRASTAPADMRATGSGGCRPPSSPPFRKSGCGS